jgi:hypothetical protein
MCDRAFFKVLDRPDVKTDVGFINVGTAGHPEISTALIRSLAISSVIFLNVSAVHHSKARMSTNEEKNDLKLTTVSLFATNVGNVGHLDIVIPTNRTDHRGGSKKKGGKTKWKRI